METQGQENRPAPGHLLGAVWTSPPGPKHVAKAAKLDFPVAALGWLEQEPLLLAWVPQATGLPPPYLLMVWPGQPQPQVCQLWLPHTPPWHPCSTTPQHCSFVGLCFLICKWGTEACLQRDTLPRGSKGRKSVCGMRGVVCQGQAAEEDTCSLWFPMGGSRAKEKTEK